MSIYRRENAKIKRVLKEKKPIQKQTAAMSAALDDLFELERRQTAACLVIQRTFRLVDTSADPDFIVATYAIPRRLAIRQEVPAPLLLAFILSQGQGRYKDPANCPWLCDKGVH